MPAMPSCKHCGAKLRASVGPYGVNVCRKCFEKGFRGDEAGDPATDEATAVAIRIVREVLTGLVKGRVFQAAVVAAIAATLGLTLPGAFERPGLEDRPPGPSSSPVPSPGAKQATFVPRLNPMSVETHAAPDGSLVMCHSLTSPDLQGIGLSCVLLGNNLDSLPTERKKR